MITLENKGSEIEVFGRSSDGTYARKDHTFKPYFYYEHDDGAYKSINGKKLKKLTVRNPKDVKEARSNYKHYEADVVYTNRYILDKLGKIEKEPIRICYFDIEIARTDKGFESPVLANNPVLSISWYDSFDKGYEQLWINDKWTEKDMLKEFVQYIKHSDPDMIVAWNGDGFDFPLLINRLKKLGLNPNEMGRGGDVSAFNTKHKTISKCYGRILFDLMYGYKKISQGGRESWSLDYISRYEKLGGKEEYKGELDDLFKTDLKKFLKYNQRDVELLVMLDEKLNIVEFFDEMRRLCSCKFEDVFMNSKMADCLCLKWAKEHNLVLPSTRAHADKPYTGGFVHASEPKLHKDIAVMDMKSLYPSIMIGFNISYETIVSSHEEALSSGPDTYINIDDKYFFRKEKGIIPSIVKPLLDKRKVVKGDMKKHNKDSREYKTLDMTQYALKVVANSFYGVLGFKLFRLYNHDCAQCVTYTAQKIIKEVIVWFEAKGYKVIYGDTDSIFIETNSQPLEKLHELNKAINIYFDKYFEDYGVEKENNIFELEFEKMFKTVFFKRKDDGKGAKKRYAGLISWPYESFSVTGFESRRSDSPQIGRDFMKQVLEMICYEKDKEEIDEFVDDFKEKIKDFFSPEQIALPIGLSKALSSYKNKPIHVRAALLANEKHNAQIQSGDKVKYMYVKDINNVIAFKAEKWMWDGYEIDYDKMIRRIVDLKIGPLYESLGWEYNYPTIIKNKKRKGVRFEDILKQNELWSIK